MLYGILASDSVNTGADSDLICVFSTPLSVRSNQPAYAQDSMNLMRKAGSQGVQRWELSAEISPTNDSSGFLVHSVTKGHNVPFYIRTPQVVGLAIPTQADDSIAASAGTDVIPIATTIAMLPGEFINIGIDTKTYMVKTCSHNSGTNISTITIMPPLRRSVVSQVAGVKRGGLVKTWVYYDTDTQLGITYTDGILSNPGSIKFVEKLE